MYTVSAGTRDVEICGTHATALQVAEIMRKTGVGDLVVVEYRSGQPVPVGIVTDRDLVVEVMAMQIDSATMTAGEIMSGKLVVANEGEQMEFSLERMRGAGVRRLPIVNSSGVLVGIVTLDDIVEKLSLTLTTIAQIGKATGAAKNVT